MQTPLPKIIVAALLVIAISLVLIAYKLYQLPKKENDQEIIYIDAASGKVYQRQGGPAQPVETTEERLKKQYPDGKKY